MTTNFKAENKKFYETTGNSTVCTGERSGCLFAQYVF